MNLSDSLQAIMPLILVMVTGMVVLLADACSAWWRRKRFLSAGLSLVGIGLAALSAVRLLQSDAPATLFGGAISGDSFSQACNLILLLAAALAVLIAMTYLENRGMQHGEYYALVLLSTSGAMIMAAATDLITLFVAIEILSVALYVLAGFARTEERSEEAALKYFLLGAFASGFLLYGIALVYGGSGVAGQPTTNLVALGKVMRASIPSMMTLAGITLLLVGLAFKAALVPFHMWTPDVYEGAPTSVTAYMAASAKIGAFAALLRVFNALVPIAEYWLIAVQILAVLTMFGGNLLAVTQDNVKRMLAYSSIAHAGYLMAAVAALAGDDARSHSAAFGAATFYLMAYTLMTMGAFAVLVWLSRRGHDVQNLRDLKGIIQSDPPAAYVMLVFMLSLGGVPPTMGFWGKWYIFSALLQAGQVWVAIALGLASIVAIYYYLKVVWMMCFQEPDSATVPGRAIATTGVELSVYVTVAASLLFGFVPNLIQPLMAAAATVARP